MLIPHLHKALTVSCKNFQPSIHMNFTGTVYNLKLPKFSDNNIIALTALIVFVIICLLHYSHLIYNEKFINATTIVCLAVFPALRFYALFNIEQLTTSELGTITITADSFVYNERQYPWTSITDATMNLVDYRYKFEFKGTANFSNNRSAGLRNEIIIEVDKLEIVRGNLYLDSREDMDALKSVLWKAVETNKMLLSIAKRLVNPENYQEHQRLKQYCS